MFKAVVWRYGVRYIEEFETKDEATNFGEYGSDEGWHFFECVLDENDIVIYDGKPDVIGTRYESEVGEKYKFD